jgi:lipopolysaccharide transport system ATP-binding protein
MYVRLAFAVAAHLEPEILLVDEVLSVGDVAFQKKCLGKMGEVAKAGRTILFVSHSMHAIRNLCPRAILLAEGRMAAEGDVDGVITTYLARTERQAEAVSVLPPGKEDVPIVGRRLLFFGEDGTLKTTFRVRERWRIVLEFEVFRSLPSVIAGVGIRTITGVPVLTHWSLPKDLSTGRYSVGFSMDIPLRACQLSFIIGLSTNERTLYYEEDVCHVTIEEIAAGKQPFRASGSGVLLTERTSEIMAHAPIPARNEDEQAAESCESEREGGG